MLFTWRWYRCWIIFYPEGSKWKLIVSGKKLAEARSFTDAHVFFLLLSLWNSKYQVELRFCLSGRGDSALTCECEIGFSSEIFYITLCGIWCSDSQFLFVRVKKRQLYSQFPSSLISQAFIVFALFLTSMKYRPPYYLQRQK